MNNKIGSLLLTRLSQPEVYLSTLLFAIVFICRAWLMHDYLVLDGDRALQVVAAEQLAAGHGYVVPQVAADNLNQQQLVHLLEWPPLYSIMLVPFLWLTGNNHFLSCFLLDTGWLFVYLLTLLLLLKILRFNFIGKWMVILLSALSFGGSIYFSFPTDLPAATVIMLTICCSLEFISSRQFKWVWLIGIYLLAAYFFRYMYLTVLPVIPLLFCRTGLNKQDKTLLRAGILLLALAAFFIGTYFIYNYQQTGRLTYTYLPNTGFYPSNLLLFAPIFWHAFTDVNFWCVQLGTRSGLGYIFFMRIFIASSFVGVILFFSNWIKKSIKRKFQLTEDKFSNFQLIGGSLSLIIILTLAILSVLRSYYQLGGSSGGWTYFQEDRYFIVPVHFILISVVGFIYQGNLKTFSWIAKSFLYFFSFFLFAHAIWMINHHSKKSKTNFSLAARDNAARVTVLEKIFDKKKISQYDKVLISDDFGNMYFAVNNGINLFRYPKTLKSDSILKVTKPSLVVLGIDAGDTTFYNPVITKYGFRLAAFVNDDKFYYTFLRP